MIVEDGVRFRDLRSRSGLLRVEIIGQHLSLTFAPKHHVFVVPLHEHGRANSD